MIKDKGMMIFRMTTLLLSTALLAAQAVPTAAVSPASQRSSEGVDATAVAQNQTAGELPDIIAARVQAELSDDLGVPVEQASIRRYSRETWSDGCLGLGGPAESCLAALTEGWQVEVVNEATGQSYFYRTDLSGDQIRLSDREQNLPPSVRERIFQAAVSSGYATADELEIADAEPQVWDGCYGLAAPVPNLHSDRNFWLASGGDGWRSLLDLSHRQCR